MYIKSIYRYIIHIYLGRLDGIWMDLNDLNGFEQLWIDHQNQNAVKIPADFLELSRRRSWLQGRLQVSLGTHRSRTLRSLATMSWDLRNLQTSPNSNHRRIRPKTSIRVHPNGWAPWQKCSPVGSLGPGRHVKLVLGFGQPVPLKSEIWDPKKLGPMGYGEGKQHWTITCNWRFSDFFFFGQKPSDSAW